MSSLSNLTSIGLVANQHWADGFSISIIDLLILGLATWRLTSLIVSEAGPWDLMAKFRHRIGIRYDDLSQPYGTNVIASAMTCVWCFSVWIGLGMAGMFLIFGPYVIMACLPLSLSAMSILIERMTDGESIV